MGGGGLFCFNLGLRDSSAPSGSHCDLGVKGEGCTNPKRLGWPGGPGRRQRRSLALPKGVPATPALGGTPWRERGCKCNVQGSYKCPRLVGLESPFP